MNMVAGEEIGNMIGDVLKVDAEDDGMAFGECLRIKIRMYISRPFMRGDTLDVGEEGEERKLWCPLTYEFLPDFCYTCGCIGHVDKQCEIRLEQGKKQQSCKSLRYIPERILGTRTRGPWQSGNFGQKSYEGRGGRWAPSGSGSDALTWRKKGEEAVEKGEKISSPPKLPGNEREQESLANKALLPELSDSVDDEQIFERRERGWRGVVERSMVLKMAKRALIGAKNV